MAHLSAGCDCAHQGDGDGTVPEASSTQLMTHSDEKGFLRSSHQERLGSLFDCVGGIRLYLEVVGECPLARWLINVKLAES